MSLQHGSDELTTRGDELAPRHDESRQPAVLSQPQGTGEAANDSAMVWGGGLCQSKAAMSQQWAEIPQSMWQ